MEKRLLNLYMSIEGKEHALAVREAINLLLGTAAITHLMDEWSGTPQYTIFYQRLLHENEKTAEIPSEKLLAIPHVTSVTFYGTLL